MNDTDATTRAAWERVERTGNPGHFQLAATAPQVRCGRCRRRLGGVYKTADGPTWFAAEGIGSRASTGRFELRRAGEPPSDSPTLTLRCHKRCGAVYRVRWPTLADAAATRSEVLLGVDVG